MSYFFFIFGINLVTFVLILFLRNGPIYEITSSFVFKTFGKYVCSVMGSNPDGRKEGSNRVKKQSSKNRKPKNNIKLKLLFRLKGLVVCAPTYDAVDGFMLWKNSQFSISALMQPSVLCI